MQLKIRVEVEIKYVLRRSIVDGAVRVGFLDAMGSGDGDGATEGVST